MASINDGQTLSVVVSSGQYLTIGGEADVTVDSAKHRVTGSRIYGPYTSQKIFSVTGIVGAHASVSAIRSVGTNQFASLASLAATPANLFNPGDVVYVGPDSFGQYSEWYSNGVRWRPRSGIIAMKNTAGSVTDAGASEQDVYSVVIPAGLIGPNDDWYVDHFWQWPNSATNKTVRVKFGGTTIASLAATTTVTGRGTTHIYMRDSKTAQIFSAASSALSFQEGQTSGTAPTTATVDTNSDITLNLTGQWGTAGAGSNLITLERVAIGIKFAY